MMLRYSLTYLALVLLSFAACAQTNREMKKECRIASGLGFGSATHNPIEAGGYFWLQLDYKFARKVSISTEFENMSYKLPGYSSELPSDLDKMDCIDNNFSLLFKYHLLSNSKLQMAVASGWTYAVKQSQYYLHEDSNNGSRTYLQVSAKDDLQIPLLMEIAYPLWKTINVQARGKYNVNRHNGNTYAAGIGLSLQL